MSAECYYVLIPVASCAQYCQQNFRCSEAGPGNDKQQAQHPQKKNLTDNFETAPNEVVEKIIPHGSAFLLRGVSKSMRGVVDRVKPKLAVEVIDASNLGTIIENMQSRSRIKILHISGVVKTEQDVQQVQRALLHCASLAHLDLSCNSIGAEGAGRLAEVLGKCRSLAHLNLSFNSIGAEGAGRLAGVLGECGSLAHLDLRNNSIGAEGAGRLAEVLGQCAFAGSSESLLELDRG